ncbi:hypothetical protein CWC17_13030 [Pseudoalteromonas sp. S3785]|nr:hypothetical protein CWC17_13030 [Pseudoalteromonas sp. S3785]
MLFFIVTPYVLNFSNNAISKNPQDWGAFGSYLGGLLSPFLAIGCLYYVVKTFKQQSFENTFNLLLEQHNDIAHKITLKGDSKASIVDDTLNKLGNEWLVKEKNSASADINESPQINSYLRVAYQVLKFVDENCPDDKRKYSRIFRSFLSNELVLLLALNSAKRNKKERFKFLKYKRLIERYEILEHLYISFQNNDVNNFTRSNNYLILERFNESAFGDCVNYARFIDSAFKHYILSGKALLSDFEKKFKKYEEINELLLNYDSFLSSMKESYNQGLPFSSKQNDYNNKLLDLINDKINIDIGDVVSKINLNYSVEYREKILKAKEFNIKNVGNNYTKLETLNENLSVIFAESNKIISPEVAQQYIDFKENISLEISNFNYINEHAYN